ncbi:MAG: [FeFe] hydrogenase H-cluster maturation GTPase HydF [Spirochaetales bacterium]|nr:[FeFe] hydrogenase H-cluster maturation GTPase HydF [Spirochaetales bacterium]
MHDTPLSEIPRIVLAGPRNAGKSSLLNLLLGREAALVSASAGTTADPVTRKMELFPLGPVALTDTAGLEDTGDLGALRMEKTRQAVAGADLILLVTPGDLPPGVSEREILGIAQKSAKPCLVVRTFADRPVHPEKAVWTEEYSCADVDNLSGAGKGRLFELLESFGSRLSPEPTPLEGLIGPGDLVVLVTPIDVAAPKGRLILPQVETLRDALDKDAAALVVKDRELYSFYQSLPAPPRLVVTDSQVFSKVAADIPGTQALTSFSLLFARKKGELKDFVQGMEALSRAPKGARILVAEGCSHHRQAEDIGTVKIPRLFRQMVHSDVTFSFSRTLPSEDELRGYYAVIHCGACMLKRTKMLNRLDAIRRAGVHVTNYGLFLGWANGLFPRALEPFPEYFP